MYAAWDSTDVCVSQERELIELGKHVVSTGKSRAKLIENCKFDDVLCREYFERFAIIRIQENPLYLWPLKKGMMTRDVLSAIEVTGKKLACFVDLLAFGANTRYMEFQKVNPVICLGSRAMVFSEEFCPCIFGRNSRELLIKPYRRFWPLYCYVLLKGS